ncbi:hypothetical protein BDK51DRAFT_24019, partial [Blyttiomyces helicus]
GDLIIGHVSMLTGLAVSPDGNHILTAERDEKIRVSRFPHCFDVEQFCLGHREFVSTIQILPFAPDLAISGGGDPSLLVWEYVKGKPVQRVMLREEGVVSVGTI